MVLMEKNGKKEYVADVFIKSYRNNGYIVVGEKVDEVVDEKVDEVVDEAPETDNVHESEDGHTSEAEVQPTKTTSTSKKRKQKSGS